MLGEKAPCLEKRKFCARRESSVLGEKARCSERNLRAWRGHMGSSAVPKSIVCCSISAKLLEAIFSIHFQTDRCQDIGLPLLCMCV